MRAHTHAHTHAHTLPHNIVRSLLNSGKKVVELFDTLFCDNFTLGTYIEGKHENIVWFLIKTTINTFLPHHNFMRLNYVHKKVYYK